MDYSPYLKVARRAATAAAARIREHYENWQKGDGPGIGLQIKADNTPVTVADKEAEQLIQEIVSEHFPKHDFFGEETGRSGTDSEFLWLVDPLDGTRGFVRRYPFFSTQIALMHAGEIVVGVSAAPMFGETAWAQRGAGAWLDGQVLQVSDIAQMDQATVSTGNLATLAGSRNWAGLGKIISRVARNRGYGDFYHYHLLAAGKIELVIESDVNILDIAALSLIVSEAGGRFTDLDGEPVALGTRSVLAGTPAIWQAARKLL